MNKLTRKLFEIEKNVLNERTNPDEVYIFTANKAENELFKIARTIVNRQKQQLAALEKLQKINPTIDYTAEENAILTLNDTEKAILKQTEQCKFSVFSYILYFEFQKCLFYCCRGV
jgi:hypothetical protein